MSDGIEKRGAQQGQKSAPPHHSGDDASRFSGPSSAPSIEQEEIPLPPGLLGDVAKFIYWNAPYPNQPIAIAGAIAFLSAIFGRAFNVSRTGLNVWIAIVGETAIGKEAASSGISRLATAIAAQCPCIMDFVGPSKWASAEAMHKRLARTPSVLGFIGELGIKLKVWCSVRAAPVFAGMIAFMLDTYGKSGRGNVLQGQENSNKDNGADAVPNPNLALLGDTTQSTLNEAMDESSIANGFLPRWIFMFAGRKRGFHNKHPKTVPDSALIDRLAKAAAAVFNTPIVTDIELTPEAEAEADKIEALCTAKVNASHAEITRHLYSRGYVNVLKIAGICAVGEAEYSMPTINVQNIMWAKHIVFAGIEHTLAQFEAGEVANEAGDLTAEENVLIEIIAQYISKPHDERYHGTAEMHGDYVITKSYIQTRCNVRKPFKVHGKMKKRAIDEAIHRLIESDLIAEVKWQQMEEKYETKAKGYVVSNANFFLKRSGSF